MVFDERTKPEMHHQSLCKHNDEKSFEFGDEQQLNTVDELTYTLLLQLTSTSKRNGFIVLVFSLRAFKWKQSTKSDN